MDIWVRSTSWLLCVVLLCTLSVFSVARLPGASCIVLRPEAARLLFLLGTDVFLVAQHVVNLRQSSLALENEIYAWFAGMEFYISQLDIPN